MFQAKDSFPVPMEPGTNPGLLYDTVGYAQLAEILRVQVDTLHRWVRSGRIRQPAYFGDRPRWSVAVVKRIIAEGTKPAGTFPPADPKRAGIRKGANRTAGRTQTPKGKREVRPTKGKIAKSSPKLRKERPE